MASMEDAFARAGKLSPRKRLESFAESAIDGAESFNGARGIFLELLMDDARAIRELMGDAFTKRAGDFLHEIWNKRHSRPGGQMASDTQRQTAGLNANGGPDDAEAQRHAAADGGGDQNQDETQGDLVPAANSPGRRAAARARMSSIMDTFAIIDRNGERLPIGDIRLSSYDRLIRMTARRSWSATREYSLLNLLKAETEKRAVHYPVGTLTRDIFNEAEMANLVDTATTLALPKITDGRNA